MNKTLKNVAQDSLIYGLGNASSKLLAFLLIPVYTRYLTTEDYGVLSSVLILYPLLADNVNLGIIPAFFRFYFTSQSNHDNELVTSNSFIFNLLSSAVFLLILLILGRQVSHIFTGTDQYGIYFQIITISLFFDNINRFRLVTYRARRKPWQYTILIGFQTTLQLILSIYFVVALHLKIVGVLLGQLLSTMVLTAVLYLYRKKPRIKWRLSLPLLKDMLAFGMPLVPTHLASWAINSAPVLLLSRLSSFTESGLFAMGFKFGSIIAFLLVTPFQLGWTPIAYSIADDPEQKDTFTRVLTYFLFSAMFACLAISALTRDILRIVATPDFYGAYEPTFLIAVSFILLGLFIYFDVILRIRMKTQWGSILWVSAAAVSISLNILFIPLLGKNGPGAANVCAYLLMISVGYFIVQKTFPLHYEFSRIAKIFIVGIALYMVSKFVQIDKVFPSILFNITIILGYPILLMFSGFFRNEEWAWLRSILANFRRPKSDK